MSAAQQEKVNESTMDDIMGVPPDNGENPRDSREDMAEVHRGFVREMDQKMSKAYGYGGLAVLLLLVALGGLGWAVGLLAHPALWIFGVTAGIGTLFLARKSIYRYRGKLREQVQSYCAINQVNYEVLIQYFEDQDLYPFFAAIFEELPQASQTSENAAEH